MNLEMMKDKLICALAGFCIGLILYSLYLVCLVFLWMEPHQSHYWMMPVPNTNLPSGLDLTRTFHQRELVAVLLGLPLPVLSSLFAVLISRQRTFPMLRRWYVQLAFIVMGLVAVLVSISYINFLLPFLLSL